MATRAQLIGANMTVDEICAHLGADSLHYVTLDGLVSATPDARGELCHACMTGEYPIPVPGEHATFAADESQPSLLDASPDLAAIPT